MKTSGVKLHLNQKIAAAYTSVFLVIVLLLTIVVAISTAADLTQIDSFLKSNYVYSVTVPSTVADNAYLQYNAGISFTVSNDAKAGVNAEVVMQTADAQYTDLVHWNTTRLKKDGIAISQNIASSNGIEIGDNLYSKNIIDGEIHKYTVEAILPAVTYIRGMKDAFHNDGIIIMGYDEQYASSITHKSIVFTAAPIEDLVSQCSSMPENIIYKDDEIDSAFASIAPYMAVYLMSIAVSMVVFILFFVKKIAHNFRRLIMLGFEKDALNKAYCFTISKYALFAIIGTVLVSTIAFGCKTFCVATITPVVCVMAVELVATAVTIAISNRQLWRK